VAAGQRSWPEDVRSTARSGPLMPYDVEPLVLSRRLEVRSDRIELSVRSPRRASGQSLAPPPQLELTAIVGNVYEVQLVFDAGALKKCVLRRKLNAVSDGT